MSHLSLRAVRLTAVTLSFPFLSLLAFSDSQVRIVRLSSIEGVVEIDRGIGQGFDKAMVNLPVTQGTKLRTADDGRAEVEFEDGSAIRLAPNTAVEFPQLSLRDSGEKVSTVEIKHGDVYLDFAGAKDNEFTLLLSHQRVTLAHSAHLRAGMGDVDATVAVFKGDVHIESPSGAVELKKNQTASFDRLDNDRYTLAKNIQQEPDDAWDKHQAEYHVRYASNSYQNYSPYAYGVSDMSYYGSFFNAPGYGMMWRPYFVGMGWDPFMNGAWAFYPGAGFGWVSSYPWGWTPYHYGTWAFVPGYGWAWQPGGVWTPWYAQPRVLNAPHGFSVPQPPRAGTNTVVVNRGPVSMPGTQSGGRLVIRNDSAGLGIRRGEINNLAKASQQVQERGAILQRVHPAPVSQMPQSARGPGSAGPASRGSEPMGRGSSAPAAPASRPSSPSPSPSPAGGAHRGR